MHGRTDQLPHQTRRLEGRHVHLLGRAFPSLQCQAMESFIRQVMMLPRAPRTASLFVPQEQLESNRQVAPIFKSGSRADSSLDFFSDPNQAMSTQLQKTAQYQGCARGCSGSKVSAVFREEWEGGNHEGQVYNVVGRVTHLETQEGLLQLSVVGYAGRDV